jgi:hypothetical protein
MIVMRCRFFIIIMIQTISLHPNFMFRVYVSLDSGGQMRFEEGVFSSCPPTEGHLGFWGKVLTPQEDPP